LIGDYSLALFFRWTDFPWNRYIHTTAGTAFGIHYTERIVRTGLSHEGQTEILSGLSDGEKVVMPATPS